MPDNIPPDNQEVVEFRKLLEEVSAGRLQSHDLLAHPLLKRRLQLFCKSHTHTQQDAEELFYTIFLKLAAKIKFEPDFSADPYGKFFAWLRTIVRNQYCDSLRRPNIKYSDKTLDELRNVLPVSTDFALEYELKERDRRLRNFVAGISDPLVRRIVELHLQGFSFRAIAAQLSLEGMTYSHTTIADVWRRFIADFMAQENFEWAIPRKGAKPSGSGNPPGDTPLKNTGS